MCLNPVPTMDVCESLSYEESLSDPKEDLVFRDNFSLSSTLSQEDSNSAGAWNDAFSFSNYPSKFWFYILMTLLQTYILIMASLKKV